MVTPGSEKAVQFENSYSKQPVEVPSKELPDLLKPDKVKTTP